jgi:NADH-quinone oxidoreductase subunit G
VIETETGILKGREQDRKKISMPSVPLKKEEVNAFKEGNV